MLNESLHTNPCRICSLACAASKCQSGSVLPSYLGCVVQSEEGGAAEQLRKVQAFVEELKTLPIAVQTAAANEQHYEVLPSGSALWFSLGAQFRCQHKMHDSIKDWEVLL